MLERYATFLIALAFAACGSESSSVGDGRPDTSATTAETNNQPTGPDENGEIHIDGELSDGDFTLPTGAFGDRHELEVEQGEVVEIILQSSDFDTYLQVVTPAGESRVNDDYPDAANQSRLTLVMTQGGRLKITATSYAPGSRGRYRLDVSRQQASDEAIAAASQEENRGGIIGDLLPNAVEIARELLGSRRHHRVDLPPPAPSQPGQPGAAQPDQNQLPGANQPAPAGPGQQVPTQPAPAQPSQPAPAAPGAPAQPTPSPSASGAVPIQMGAQVQGRLEASDGTLATGEYRDLYSFEGQAGSSVNIELQSAQFDTYLVLVSPSGQQWENDDANGALNSQLVMTLPETGTYRIVATSFRPGETGDYLLKLRAPGAVNVPTAPGAATQPQQPQPLLDVSGSLAQGDQQLSSGELMDRHQVELQTGQAVSVRLESSQFDTYLIVRAPSDRQWDNDDFQQGSLNSGLDLIPPETGQYTIAVTSYQAGETGDYHLVVRPVVASSTVIPAQPGMPTPQPGMPTPQPGMPTPQPGMPTPQPGMPTPQPGMPAPQPGMPTPQPGMPAPQPGMPSQPTPGSVAAGQPLQGALAQGDSQLNSGEFMDAYPMQLSAGQRVSFRVSSSQFDTYLIVRSPSGRQWDNDDMQPGNLNSGLDLTLTEAGNYRVIVTSYRPGETGNYTLTVTPGGQGGQPGLPTPQPGLPGVAPGPGGPSQPLPPGGVRQQPGGGRVWGIYVGITEYPSGRLPLCADDAIKFAEDMRRAGLQTEAQQVLLTDANATPERVRQAFARLASQIGPNDVFIFFYSGHGAQGSEQPGSQELDHREESINLIGGDITDDEMARLFDQIRSRVSIIALDSCFSGGFARDVISQPGRMGFFSSEEDLTSNVASSFQAGGYLSHFLRLGMRGDADNNPRDSLLTAGELSHYLYTMYGTHMQDVRASTTDSSESYQHLVIDRGSVRVNTPLVSYR